MSHILRLSQNTKGRDFVIGDIHGAFELLDQTLLAAGFDPAKDRLISVGDLVDRGPQSPQCLYYLAQPWFHAIRGNHENLFLKIHNNGDLDEDRLARNIQNGVAWILWEDKETLEDIRAAFDKLPIAIEVETPEGRVGFVHADIPPGMDWDTFTHQLDVNDETLKKIAVLSRVRIQKSDDSGVDGISRVFFGHTPVAGGPKMLGNCFFIDTGAVFKVLHPNDKADFFMALIDIRADAADIVNPAATRDPLIRLATVRDNPNPAAAPKPPAPPKI